MPCELCGWTKYNKDGSENEKHSIKYCRDRLVKKVKRLERAIIKLRNTWKDW